ncbi:MAG: cytochrome C oxidase subunit IV family protein [Phycisphaerales bacterium]|nr:cytochrome C oxidase subunit IV family protein [Phycisphaerales bacterium]
MSQDTNTTANSNLDWDANDPHGINPHDDDHGHFIADWRMQVGVLLALLVFTALTVGFYNLEQWVETAFEITLPKWINIAGAMSIALVKGILVAAFFMQLRYDKALNTFVMLFCLFCVSLFLGFAMIDLDNRGWIDENRAVEIQDGGVGAMLNAASADEAYSIIVGPKVNTAGMSLVHYARLHGNENEHGLLYYREKGKEAEFWAHFYEGHATHRDLLDEHNFFEQMGFGHHDGTSSANKSVPRHGLTPGLFSDVAPVTDAHSSSHGSSHESESETESHDDDH